MRVSFGRLVFELVVSGIIFSCVECFSFVFYFVSMLFSIFFYIGGFGKYYSF